MKKILIIALVLGLVGGLSAYALAEVYGPARMYRAQMGGGWGYGMGGMMGGYGPGGGYGMGPGMMGMGPGMMGGYGSGGCPGFSGASASGTPAGQQITLDKAKEIAESFVKANLPNAQIKGVELERFGYGGFFRADLKLASGETGVLHINPFTGEVAVLRILPKS